MHLDQYGDAHADIMKCLDYALDQAKDKGAFAVIAREGQQIVGAS
ncbi:N-acetyltransferase GCN5, partial [Nitritalea halalkaliphila LW7]